jgi:hypothetical protein
VAPPPGSKGLIPKVRKKEADGGLRKRLFYAVQHSEGDWDVYAKEQALEMFHGQILNPLARKNRCFSRENRPDPKCG